MRRSAEAYADAPVAQKQSGSLEEMKDLTTNIFKPFVNNGLEHQPEIPLIGQQTAQRLGIEAPLTAQQLAAIVPLHPVTLLRWAREGKIPHRRLSTRKIVFLPSEINRWLCDGSDVYAEPVGHAA